MKNGGHVKLCGVKKYGLLCNRYPGDLGGGNVPEGLWFVKVCLSNEVGADLNDIRWVGWEAFNGIVNRNIVLRGWWLLTVGSVFVWTVAEIKTVDRVVGTFIFGTGV
ncbi:hypothetical protein JTB14_024415 [Gonioctena quinquepunctata]|nr:hypothetical protein JTB14_024415 [Gonioctena quinquepunctata]